MIKRLGTCFPKDGIDPDEFWDYHTLIHAPDTVRVSAPGFNRYVMSRVTKVMSGYPRFYDLTEIWYEDEETMDKCHEAWKSIAAPAGKAIHDDFNSWVVENCSFIVEQIIAKDNSPKNIADMQTNKLIKRAATCSPKEGIDPDEFWKYHTEVHAPDILKASGPGLKKYVISRVTKVVEGQENQRFYDLVELWWDSEESMNKDYEVWKNTRLPNGKTIFDDFDDWIANASSFMMEEFIAKECRS